jgi:hypothetical protein
VENTGFYVRNYRFIVWKIQVAPHNIFRGKRAVTVVFGKTAL